MQNKLHKLAQFRSVLADYKLSPESQKVLQKTKLVLLVAPTSSGRNTIIRELVSSGEYHYIISDTTRQPRVNDGVLETDGMEYWFRNEEEVLSDLQEGKFLEAAIIHNQQVSGISIRELERAHAAHKVAITDIETAGAATIVKAKPDTDVLFVVPPTFEEWQHRLHHRGPMMPDEIRRRLESAIEEFELALSRNYYRFVISDTVPHAMEQIHELVIEGTMQQEDQVHGRQVVEQLLERTKAYVRLLP